MTQTTPIGYKRARLQNPSEALVAKASKNHHWWPVGLQSYWADVSDDVHWITPLGQIVKKRFKRRKIGAKLHGHTMLRGSDWESNFESIFQIDDEVHWIVGNLEKMVPGGQAAFKPWVLDEIKDENVLSALRQCAYYPMDEQLHRSLLFSSYQL